MACVLGPAILWQSDRKIGGITSEGGGGGKYDTNKEEEEEGGESQRERWKKPFDKYYC